nr:hypothetical protein [Tessaracoccus coleopterorum]
MLCSESVDLPDDLTVNEFQIDAATLTDDGVGAVIKGSRIGHNAAAWPYHDGGHLIEGTLDVPLVPYHSWANRGPATMRVWLPEA